MKRLATAVAALTLLLTACGPDLGSGRTACQLITKADVQKTIPEHPVKDGLANGTQERSRCFFADQRAATGGVNVAVTVDRTAGSETWDQDRQGASGTPGHKVTDEPNLGDRAFVHEPPAGGAATVEVLTGDAVLTVHVDGTIRAAQQAVSLARRGLTRI